MRLGPATRATLWGVAASTAFALLVSVVVWTTVTGERTTDLQRAALEQTELVLTVVRERPEGTGDPSTDQATVRALRVPGRRDVLLVTPRGAASSSPSFGPEDVPGDVVRAVEASLSDPATRRAAVTPVPREDGSVVSGGAVDATTRVFVLVSARDVDRANVSLQGRLWWLVALAAAVGALSGWAGATARARRVEQEALRERERNADMAHELRTPVATMLAASTLAAEAVQGQPAEVSGPVRLVAEEARRLRWLVDDLLELTRIESAEHGRDPEVVDLARLLPSVLGARSWPVPVLVDVEPGVAVLAERRDITRLVMNLVDNATRYAREEVRVACRRHGTRLRLVVSDDGPGIGADDADRVFDRFWSGPRSGAGGTGLGLTIVRVIARRLGGDAHVDTAATDGATLVVVLPLAPQGRRVLRPPAQHPHRQDAEQEERRTSAPDLS